MSLPWLRPALARLLLLAACAAPALLASCGGGDVQSQFVPARIVAFGDGFSDLGQRGTRYTVNDGSVNVWSQQVAASYGRPLTAAAAGGFSYATGNARVAARPDAAGDNATPTVVQQVDTFLAAQALGAGDLVIISGGISDIVAEVGRLNAGAQSREQMLANVGQAGRDLAAQVSRLVRSGAKYVLLTGTYDLGRSPWATATGQADVLSAASARFNEQMLVSIVDLGANVLYVDAALQYNLVTSSPRTYGFTDATTLACTSADAGAGIGTGAGQVNSALCTPATVAPGVDPNTYVFADRLYPTPQSHRRFGEYAYSRFRTRF